MGALEVDRRELAAYKKAALRGRLRQLKLVIAVSRSWADEPPTGADGPPTWADDPPTRADGPQTGADGPPTWADDPPTRAD
ncbi:MAG TPA: hypothetical protein VE078_11890, partial [Thermoanaerobaculia bacterium]|nr:hypothetical protein [Thermoanaerobaculia bacterium]